CVVRVRVSRERQEIPHDLRIGLPIEPVGLDGPRRTGFVEECALNGAAAGAVGPQERAIDVEQDELHETKIGARTVGRTGGRAGQAVSVSPRPPAAPPPGSPATAWRPAYPRTGR